MRRFWLMPLALLTAVPAASAASPDKPDRVLLVVSGHGQAKVRPGFEMDELSQAYLILRDNGLQVDVASPGGGAVVPDRYNPAKPYNAEFLKDATARAKLASTLPIKREMAGHYSAVYIMGGKGAMFDLPKSPELQQLIRLIHARGGVVAAVCHGPAVLATVRLDDGRFLVQGRNMTGFTDEEEQLFGKGVASTFPFPLEPELRRLGARFTEAPIMLNHVVVDDRLVTGQNPYSTALATEAVVRQLGIQPAAREPWRDERSLTLVARAARGELDWAKTELQTQAERYDLALIGAWGFYQAKAAGSDLEALKSALNVMELVQPHFSKPELKLAIEEARAQIRKLAS